MRTMTRLAGLAVPALLAAAIVAVPASAAATTSHLHAPLGGSGGYPAAAGYSDYYGSMGMMGNREAKVTVNHITQLAGQRVVVFLNGTRVGTMLVSATGHAYHDWTGQWLPYCMGGSRVVVRTTGGKAVATGAYR